MGRNTLSRVSKSVNKNSINWRVQTIWKAVYKKIEQNLTLIVTLHRIDRIAIHAALSHMVQIVAIVVVTNGGVL